MSENSNLLQFSEQVSKIVFLAYFNVLPPVTTVWCEMWENSYLHHFSLQVSQIVFLTDMTVLHLITNELPEI